MTTPAAVPMSIDEGQWVELRNGWIVGPLTRHVFVGPYGVPSVRFRVADGGHLLDWSPRGSAYVLHLDIIAIITARA